MTQAQESQDTFDQLTLLFRDQPDLLRIVTSRDLAAQQLLIAFRQRSDQARE
ncbi:MAG TPA: hypothetical protein VHZ03_47220 [Trebonia sp.]|jgi:hypothetical protein|nr:hypothetical protein [Trebonia sp.]